MLNSSSSLSPCAQPSLLHRSTMLGLCAGAAGVFTELIFYSLDSYKVVQQAGEKFKFSTLFRGALPIALLGSGPSFASFFLFYYPTKSVLEEYVGSSTGIPVLAASLIGAVPSSLAWVPADVVKKRLLLTSSSTVTSAIREVYRESGLLGFTLGWRANILKDIPFAVLKMSLYEGIASVYFYVTSSERTSSQLTDAEAAGIGFASGAVTAIVTCPLDCVNTRIKSGELSDRIVAAHGEIIRKDGIQALFRGLAPRIVMLGCGSTLFWYAFYNLKHALHMNY